MNFCDKLKRWRGVDEARDCRGALSQSEAAAALGLSLRVYQNYEQGHRTPRGLLLEILQGKISKPLSGKARRPARAGKNKPNNTGARATTRGGGNRKQTT